MQKHASGRHIVTQLTSAFYGSQMGLIEEAYGGRQDRLFIRSRYVNAFLKALKYLDEGKAVLDGKGNLVYSASVQVVDGSAPVVALALGSHGLGRKEQRKLADRSMKNAPEFAPYWEMALPLLEKYAEFLDIVHGVEKNCEYVPTVYGYDYSIETAAMKSYLDTIADAETLGMLFAMRAIDEFTKIEMGDLERIKRGQREGRSMGEISVGVLHLYGPIMERLRYHELAQLMYDHAFGVADTTMHGLIKSEMENAGYTKSAFGLIGKILGSTIGTFENLELKGRIKGAYSLYRKMLKALAANSLKSEISGWDSLAASEQDNLVQKKTNELAIQLPDAKKEWVRNYLKSAYDVFGFRVIDNLANAQPQDCNALRDMLYDTRYWGAYFLPAGHERNYIDNPKKNGYISRHTAARLNLDMEDELARMLDLSGGKKRTAGLA